MEQFKLWNSPTNSFYQEIKGFTNEVEGLKKELKIKFSEVFSGGAIKWKLNPSKRKMYNRFSKRKGMYSRHR